MKTEKMTSISFSIILALAATATAVTGTIYHGVKAVIKGILAIAGVFKGVKKAHKRIDALEIQVREINEVMAPQISAIYQHLLGEK
jgi:hypothetical protein